MRRIARGLAVAILPLSLLASGCGDDEAESTVFTIEVVTPAGEDPLEGVHTARVSVRQGEGDTEVAEEPVEDGFDIRLPVADQLTPVAVTVELWGDGVRRVGAPPPFSPVELFAADLVIPVGPPRTCGIVADADIRTGRAAPGFTRHGTFALVIGGVSAEGPSDRAGFVDLLDFGGGEFRDLTRALGRTRAIPYSTARSIVLSEQAAPFRYDIGSAETPELPGALHAGAGLASGAIALGGDGAVVVGGEEDGAPSGGVTWVGRDGGTVTTTLLAPRTGPAVARVGSAVLVVGGVAGGPWAELVERGVGRGSAVDVASDGERTGGILVSHPSSQRALLVGGVDAAGEPRTDTVLFDCSADCVTEPGPAWDGARSGATLVALPGGGGLLLGGEIPTARVDQVLFDGEGAHIEPWGDLEAPRSDPAGLALPSGVVYVAGGTGEGGPRADIEVCFVAEPVVAL